MCKLDVKSRYQQIKELMGECKYFETERDIFCVGDECVIYQMRITDSKEEAHQLLEKYMQWKDPQLIAWLMEKQEKIQTILLQMLSKEIVKTRSADMVWVQFSVIPNRSVLATHSCELPHVTQGTTGTAQLSCGEDDV